MRNIGQTPSLCLALSLCTLASLLAGTTSAEEETRADNDTFMIGKAPAAASTATAQGDEQVASPAENKATELKDKVPPPRNLDTLLKTIKSNAAADSRVEALQALYATPFHPVPREVSARLFNTALLAKEEGVRREATKAMRALDDQEAMKNVFGAALHPKLDGKVRKNAGQALRWLDHPQLVYALVHIVSLELRVGVAREAGPPQTIFISNGLDVNNPLGNINLPIELPNIEISSIKTSVAVLALSALQTISGRDLGKDPAAWKGWFKQWKHIHDVRAKQAGR